MGVSILLICQELHGHLESGDECHTQLQPGWKFCPQCGRKTGRLEIDSPQLRFAPAGNGVHSSAALRLQHTGQNAVDFSVRIPAPSPESTDAAKIAALKFPGLSGQPKAATSGTIGAGSIGRVELTWSGMEPPPHDRPLQVLFDFKTDDGEPHDPFELGRENRTRFHDPGALWIEVSRPAPPQLRVETDVCLFGSGRMVRQLNLMNSGDTPLRLRPLKAPGYEIAWEDRIDQLKRGAHPSPGRQNESWILRGGERKEYRILARPTATVGRTLIEIADATGRPLGAVELLRAEDSSAKMGARYIIGVDFGTSGTSVWVRDGRDHRLPATPLEAPGATADEDVHRAPTLVYVKSASGKNEFLIGYQAQRAFERDSGRGGFLVRELKSLLRDDQEPFVGEHGQDYTVDRILQRYLEVLKAEVIDPALEDGVGASIEWNFSLPVLDKHYGSEGDLYKLQKERMERAIWAAGYVGSNCSLKFHTEPFCAAVSLLLKKEAASSVGPRDGEWMCVFDSGGGTTDVVLGRIRLEQGELHFEEFAALGGVQAGEGQAVTTFGGETLLWRTAMYLSLWAPEKGANPKFDYLKHASFVPRDKIVRERLLAIAHRAIETGDNAFLGRDGALNDPLWLQFPNLLRRTEQIKRTIASLAGPRAKAEIVFDEQNPDNPRGRATIQRSEFDEQVIDRRLDSVIEAMKTVVFGDGAPPFMDVKWVFPVGGNSRVVRIQDRLREIFPRGIQEVDAKERMLAVSAGTVWASRARRDNSAPYDLFVKDEAGRVLFHVEQNDSIADTSAPHSIVWEIPAKRKHTFCVAISGRYSVHGQDLPFAGQVAAFVLSNQDSDARSIEARFSFERGALVVRSSENDGEKVVLMYQI